MNETREERLAHVQVDGAVPKGYTLIRLLAGLLQTGVLLAVLWGLVWFFFIDGRGMLIVDFLLTWRLGEWFF